MSAETLERSVLEGKDRDQLVAIASALGLKALSRAKKGEIIDRILEHTGAGPASDASAPSNGHGDDGRDLSSPNGDGDRAAGDGAAGDAAAGEGANEPLADWEIALGSADEPNGIA